MLDVREAVLDNGLRVRVVEDGALPIVAVEVWYDVGSRDERPGRTGFAHLFEHLMFEGSASVAPGEHFRSLQSVGAVVNGTTSFDRTTYYQTVPSEHVDLALWLEADRMGGLLAALTQESLDNQRDVVKNERRQRYDNVPYGSLWERVNALVFPDGHPYHHRPIGSMADLDAASLDDCREFFTTHYAPDTAVLTLVGDVTFDAAVDAATRYFGGLRAGGRAARSGIAPLPPGARVEERVTGEPVPAALVAHGYRLPGDGSPALEPAIGALSVLARGNGARLRRALVRERRLAAAVSYDVTRLSGGTSFATVRVRGLPGVSAEVLSAALDAEVAALVPTDAEVARAAALAERSWLDDLASVTLRAELVCRYGAALPEVGHRSYSFEPDAVREAAAAWLRPEHAAVVTYEAAA